jgi:hypothetical protein
MRHDVPQAIHTPPLQPHAAIRNRMAAALLAPEIFFEAALLKSRMGRANLPRESA